LSKLATRIRGELAAAANPLKAPDMQAYMKSAMPYRGVQMPQLRAITRQAIVDHPLATRQAWQSAVLELWRGAKFREERYAAVELISFKRYTEFRTPEVMPMLEEMVVTGAWWDHVDELSHIIGDLLLAYPKQIRPLMRAWSTDENLWKRRVSIICQVGLKRDTDLKLLYANIKPNLADRDFFIRKAIGWALRDHARVPPDWVRSFLDAHEPELSGLSRREAMRHLSPGATPAASPTPRVG